MAVDPGMVKAYCWACGRESSHSRIFYLENGGGFIYVHAGTVSKTPCELAAEEHPRLQNQPPAEASLAQARKGIIYFKTAEGLTRPHPDWDHLVERVRGGGS
jgi:hypothetical protein